MTRGTGETTRQMQALPLHGIFVWCRGDLRYAQALQHHIARPDIKVVTPNWVMSRVWEGLTISGLTVDHATIECMPIKELPDFYYLLHRLQTRIRT